MTNYKESGCLVSCFVDVLLYISQLNRVDEKKELNSIISRIDAKFRNSAKISLSIGNDIRDYDIARFAVCAWVDEHLMSVEWRYKKLWRNHLLQGKYYDTSNAGVEFFERLSQLGISRNVVREVYLLCMCIGFRGQYARYEDFEKICSLRDEALNKLHLGGLSDGSIKIFRDAYPTKQLRDMGSIYGEGMVRKKHAKMFLLWCVGSVSLALVYVAYSALLTASSNGVNLSGYIL